MHWKANVRSVFSVSYLAAGVVGVFGQFSVESLEENLVCDFAHVHAGFIQHREDALMLLLHQIHDDLIIEVIDLTRKDTEDQKTKSNIHLGIGL